MATPYVIVIGPQNLHAGKFLKNETLHYHISSYSGNGDLLSCRLYILANHMQVAHIASTLLTCRLQHIAKVAS